MRRGVRATRPPTGSSSCDAVDSGNNDPGKAARQAELKRIGTLPLPESRIALQKLIDAECVRKGIVFGSSLQ